MQRAAFIVILIQEQVWALCMTALFVIPEQGYFLTQINLKSTSCTLPHGKV